MRIFRRVNIAIASSSVAYLRRYYTYNIEKVEGLAKEVTGRVAVVQMHSFDDILDQSFGLSLPLLLSLDHGASHTLGYHSDLTLFPLFPHPVRHVEEHALEEQHEWHPLVVRVVLLFAVVAAQARVSHVGAHRLSAVRQCKRVRDPTVRVDHMGGHRAVGQAVDGVTCANKRDTMRPPDRRYFTIYFPFS